MPESSAVLNDAGEYCCYVTEMIIGSGRYTLFTTRYPFRCGIDIWLVNIRTWVGVSFNVIENCVRLTPTITLSL